MDIEKLIERLRNNNIENNCHDCALGYYAFEAAAALSTLQAENEKLRAELEQVKAERDAAVEDFRTHRKYKCDCCYYADKQSRFPCTECQSPISTYGDGWKWRGPQKED